MWNNGKILKATMEFFKSVTRADCVGLQKQSPCKAVGVNLCHILVLDGQRAQSSMQKEPLLDEVAATINTPPISVGNAVTFLSIEKSQKLLFRTQITNLLRTTKMGTNTITVRITWSGLHTKSKCGMPLTQGFLITVKAATQKFLTRGRPCGGLPTGKVKSASCRRTAPRDGALAESLSVKVASKFRLHTESRSDRRSVPQKCLPCTPCRSRHWPHSAGS